MYRLLTVQQELPELRATVQSQRETIRDLQYRLKHRDSKGQAPPDELTAVFQRRQHKQGIKEKRAGKSSTKTPDESALEMDSAERPGSSSARLNRFGIPVKWFKTKGFWTLVAGLATGVVMYRYMGIGGFGLPSIKKILSRLM